MKIKILFYSTNCYKGFTLSEVLITLGIIGVVSVIMMSTLINKIQEKEFKTAYKKAYSSINQAVLYMFAEGEYLNTSQNPSYNFGENFKILSKYLKTTKTCFDNNADECWVCNDGQAGYIHRSGEPDWLGCSKASYAFIDASGMGWYIYSNQEPPFIVDVNGMKKPNKLGRDRFKLYFASGNDNEQFVKYANRVRPA